MSRQLLPTAFVEAPVQLATNFSGEFGADRMTQPARRWL
jgi:hypothetical protein